MMAAALLFRFALSTAMVLAGCLKLLTMPRSAALAWRPNWLNPVWPSLFTFVACLDILLGIAVLLAPSQLVMMPFVAYLGGATIYGWWSIKKTGTCGCYGADSPRSTARSFLLRNGALLLLALAILLVAGADPEAMQYAAPLAGFAGPLLALAIVTLGPVSRALRRITPLPRARAQ